MAGRTGKRAALDLLVAAKKADPLASLRARPETAIVSAILDALRSVPGVVAWRNNTGAVTVPARGTRKRRFVRFGQPGMSDIIGWKSWRPARDAVGRVVVMPAVAVFIALEVKRPGQQLAITPQQSAFLQSVMLAGGIAAVVTSVDEALAAVRGDSVAGDAATTMQAVAQSLKYGRHRQLVRDP